MTQFKQLPLPLISDVNIALDNVLMQVWYLFQAASRWCLS